MAKKGQFNAEQFVDFLLTEGAKVPCDDTIQSFGRNEKLPSFYDESKYKRAQAFFYEHIFALFYGKLLGLMSVLALPSILKILMFTQMSSSAITAYKRYMATIFHMCVWYDSDFQPGSKLWESIKDVKKKHNFASNRCCTAGLHRISQKDMALTQFGFMGYALAKREMVGMHNVKNEDWQAFIHLWRVIGYIMGIEDRFNICRDSVEETTEICKLLISKVIKPAVSKKDPQFIRMARYLIDGLWAMNPSLETTLYLTMLWKVLQSESAINNNETKIQPYLELNWFAKMMVFLMELTLSSLQFSIFRRYHNFSQVLTLWLMKMFPFLAYYKFGHRNAHVDILPNVKKIM